MSYIITAQMQVGVDRYYGTNEQQEMLILALRSFGHLIKTVHNRRISFGDFADVIAKHYDQANPKTHAVVDTLRQLDIQNPPQANALDSHQAA